MDRTIVFLIFHALETIGRTIFFYRDYRFRTAIT